MARRFNPEDYSFDKGANKWLHKNNEYARKSARLKIEAYYQSIGKPLPYETYGLRQPKDPGKASQNARAAVRYNVKDYFRSNVQWKNGAHLQDWAKPLAITGGKDTNYGWSKREYFDSKSSKMLKTSSRWGVDVGGHKGGSGGILNGGEDFLRHLQLAIHAVEINAANFRIVVGQRAMKVFQTSFVKKKFYNRGAHKWRALAEYTKKKRRRRGTGVSILDEYGDLKKSIKLKENAGKLASQVYTDIVPANDSHHKKHSICYAGYHNEGKGQYGRARNGHKPHRYYKRKFMGHSSHLNPLTDEFMMKLMKLYLFDSVFLVKEGQLLSAK